MARPLLASPPFDPVELAVGAQPLSELVDELRRSGVRHNAYADRLLVSGWAATTEAGPVRVEVHTVGGLGWPAGAPVDDVLRNVADGGLAPCPLEVALLLRLAWRSRVVSPRVTVASARAHPDASLPRGFYLVDDAHGCWLRAYVASDDWVAGPEERLALLRRA